MEPTEQEPTAAQMLGTVRSVLKLYKDFEHLSKVVYFLEQQEAYEAKLKASVRNLEIDKADFAEDIEVQAKRLAELESRVEETQVALDQVNANADSTRNEIVGKAKKEADALIQRSEQAVADISARGEALRAENVSLEKEIFKKKSEIEDMKQQYQQEKDRIIKALNG